MEAIQRALRPRQLKIPPKGNQDTKFVQIFLSGRDFLYTNQ